MFYLDAITSNNTFIQDGYELNSLSALSLLIHVLLTLQPKDHYDELSAHHA